MADDGTLLRDYAQSNSEDAFAELVRRHLDLVYSTALRVLNRDEHLAKDICQTVFADLARKAASLTGRAALSGWLYTSTCFTAAKMVRSEQRRRLREERAKAIYNETDTPNEESHWQKMRPVLDSIMLELKHSDREALLLRFFERHSLADVGRKLGLSENTPGCELNQLWTGYASEWQDVESLRRPQHWPWC